MYQALYRKYRPKTFNEVVGQDVVIQILKNSIKNNKLSHAYLFTGPRGTGKTSVAKLLAKTVNCIKIKDFEPCNNCVMCTQKENIDIIEIDAASNNGVDEIREIRNKINLVPSLGKYKVYIIDEVHMLSIGAFNALLKTLEEPPSHIIFILATTEPHKIPSTILSRCQRLDFKKVSEEKITEKLKNISQQENIEISDEAIREISRLSDGGLRDAISILDQAISYSENEIKIEDIHEINGTLTASELNIIIDNIFQNDIKNVLDVLDEYVSKGKNVIKLSEEIMLQMKNILIYKTAKEYFIEKAINIEIYQNISKNMNIEDLFYAIDEISNSINEIKYSNNPKLKIELVIIKIMKKINKNEPKKELEKIKEKDNRNNPSISIKNEIKKEETVSIIEETNPVDKVSDNLEITEKLKNIRINNTLSEFDKNLTNKLKKEIQKIEDFIFKEENSQIISLILDGQLKAASNKNIIFVYDSSRISEYFNKKIIEIENIIEEYLKINYKLIATDNKNWEIIKKEFNNKQKKYVYIEENLEEELRKINYKETGDIENIFGEIVEYK